MRLVLTASLSVLSFNSVAFSCFCGSFRGFSGFGGGGGALFLGGGLAVTDLSRASDDVFLFSRRAQIRVDESFGGIAPDVHQVDVLTGSGGGDCGIPFKVGEVYLIDAFVGKDGLVHAAICSSTRRIDASGAALRIL